MQTNIPFWPSFHQPTAHTLKLIEVFGQLKSHTNTPTNDAIDLFVVKRDFSEVVTSSRETQSVQTSLQHLLLQVISLMAVLWRPLQLACINRPKCAPAGQQRPAYDDDDKGRAACCVRAVCAASTLTRYNCLASKCTLNPNPC